MEQKEIEIDLKDIFNSLKKNKWFIFISTILVLTISVVVTLRSPSIYKATAVLSAIETIVIDENGRPQKLGLSAGFYVPLIKNEFIIEQVINELGLDKKPYNFTRNSLQSKIRPIIEGDGRLLNINVEVNNPIIARNIANNIAEKIVDLSYQLKNGEGTKYQDFMRQQVDVSKEKMDKANARILVFRKKSDLEVLKQRLDTKLAQRGRFEVEYEDLANDMKAQEENIKEVAKNFGEQEKTIKLSKSISEDPTFNQVMAKASQQEVHNLLGLKMESEEVNPLYQGLKTQLVNNTIALANMKVKKQILEQRIKDTDIELERIRKEYADKEVQISSLQRQFDLVKEEYISFARQEAIAKTLMSSSIGNLSIVNLAITPNKPSRPGVVTNAVISALIGLVLSSVFVVIKEEFKRTYLS